MNVTELSASIMLERVTEFVLSSLDEEGFPRGCVVTKVRGEAYHVLYCATGTNSTKGKQFRRDPRAGACYYLENDSVTLVGKVTFVTEPALRRALWQDWMIHEYPAGLDDPHLCFLRFEGERAALLIQGHYEEINCPR